MAETNVKVHTTINYKESMNRSCFRISYYLNVDKRFAIFKRIIMCFPQSDTNNDNNMVKCIAFYDINEQIRKVTFSDTHDIAHIELCGAHRLKNKMIRKKTPAINQQKSERGGGEGGGER